MLALERSRSIQSHKTQLGVVGHAQPPGSISPDGIPTIHIKSSIGPEDLKLPINRKKRPRELEPETPKVKESPKPVHRCTQPNCEFGVKGFETKAELEDHYKWHEAERRRQEEEEEKNRRKIADPFDYYLSSAREGLGLGDDGKPKGRRGEAMNEETPLKTGTTPQIKPASTPLLGTTPMNKAGLTPMGRSPAPFKPPQLSNVKTPSGKHTPGAKTMPKEEHANEQLPTPPSSSAWEGSSMSPDVIRQCFDGLREQVSGLSTLNPAIFTPAYTPGASDLEIGEGGENVNGSFEDWNPFGYKDNLADDMMQEMEWDSDCSNLFGGVGLGGKDWALAHGFELKI